MRSRLLPALFVCLLGACDDCPDDGDFTDDPGAVPGDPDPSDPGDDVGTSCATDAECGEGQVCCDGLCKDARVPEDEATCTYSGECGGGLCDDGGLCHAPCTVDADCGTGDVCSSGTCWTNPTPTIQCLVGADCGEAHSCINGTCHPHCAGDAECADPGD